MSITYPPDGPASLEGRIKRLAQRSAVMLSGELMQSAFHFALNLLLMRTLSPGGYGTFALVFLFGGISLTYIRSIAGLPANLLIPPYAGTRRTVPFELAFGTMAACVSALAAVIVIAILQLWLGTVMVSAGVFVGAWTLRSYVRSVLFAKGLRGIATVSDLVFTIGGVVLGAVFIFGIKSADPLHTIFLLLAATNVVSIGAAFAMQGHWPRLTARRSARLHYARIARQVLWGIVGTTTTNIQGQGQVLLIAAFVGPGGYAPLAAMMVFFAPLRLTTAALTNMVQPELSTLWTTGRRDRAMLLVWRWTGGLCLLGLAYGAALFCALSLIDFPIFAGQPRERIAVLSWLIAMPPVLYLMPKLVLEVRRSFRTLAAIGMGAAVIGMSLVAVILAIWHSASWALLGSLAAEIAVLAGCWIALLRRGTVIEGDEVAPAAGLLPEAGAAQRARSRPC